MKQLSIADVPELLQWIGRYLDFEDVATCTLVNQQWNTQFSAVLWHTLRLPFHVPPGMLSDPSSSLYTAIQKHGRHIRALTFLCPRLPPPEDIEFLTQHCPQLDGLALNVVDQGEWITVAALLRHYPALSKLTLAISMAALDENATKAAQVLARVLPSDLVSLNLTQNAGPPSLVLLLLRQCRHLKQLMLSMVMEGDVVTEKHQETPSTFFSNDTTETSAPSTLSYELEDLSIISCPWPLAEHLLTHSPKLQHVKLPKIHLDKRKQLQLQLMRRSRHHVPFSSTSSYIVKLDLSHLRENFGDTDLAQLLKACPPNTLRHLILADTMAGNKTADAVLKYQSGTLETLDMRQCTGTVSSLSIQDLLSNCRRLRVFAVNGGTRGRRLSSPPSLPPPPLPMEHAPGDGANDGGSNVVALRAKEIVTTPWCCGDLRVLCVPIIDICRDSECRTHELCQLQQWQIYKQLGKLTRLETLDLSNNCGAGGGGGGGGGCPQGNPKVLVEPESLEWTLESGMAELAGLIKLQSFDLRGTDHLLGEEEVVWMKDHWPSLQRIRGLTNPLRVSSDDVKEFARGFWPEIMIE